MERWLARWAVRPGNEFDSGAPDAPSVKPFGRGRKQSFALDGGRGVRRSTFIFATAPG